jgi:hypothetical protein
MKRIIVCVAIALAVLGAPRAWAQSASSEGDDGKPWVRLVFIVPVSAALGYGAVYARRRFRRDG